MKYNVLVTGCGGDIGQSIGKILNESAYINKLYGSDISDENAGPFIYTNFILGVNCNAENYLLNLEHIIESKNIDLVLPIAEPELRFFSKNNISGTIGRAKLIMASDQALEIGFDKLLTADFLQKSGLPFPKTLPVASVDKVDEFPVILKSRTGSGSSAVHVLRDEEEFSFYKKRNPEHIVQEYLAGDDGEFTCGVFRSSQKVIRTIILKRKLTGGFSGFGIVIENPLIEQLLISIAEKLDLRGSINVQLRITEKGPVVFEINPRFSSTVLFRHMLGFEDVIWSIQDSINVEISNFNGNQIGKKFYKGFNEFIS